MTVFAEPTPTPLALLLLGRGDRPGRPSAASTAPARCRRRPTRRWSPAPAPPRTALGDRLFVLGHHYQRDEVIEFADVTGDSFKLAQQAAARPEAEFIVFCGVHFMAESADVLTGAVAGRPPARPRRRLLDGRHGDLRPGRGVLGRARRGRRRRRRRARHLHELQRRDQGVHRPARRHRLHVDEREDRRSTWAFQQAGKVLFLPDQHLGRNTAVREMGLSLDDCVLYDPHKPLGGLTVEQLRDATMILWKGHCSVHGRFTARSVAEVRERVPGVTVLVHPECTHEVVEAADLVGSTEFIIQALDAAPAGSSWAIGTELNLVRRLANAHPDKTVVFLDKDVCYCSTMNRIDLPHLVWTLEELVAGRVPNRIEVEPQTAREARAALDRMLALPGVGALPRRP